MCVLFIFGWKTYIISEFSWKISFHQLLNRRCTILCRMHMNDKQPNIQIVIYILYKVNCNNNIKSNFPTKIIISSDVCMCNWALYHLPYMQSCRTTFFFFHFFGVTLPGCNLHVIFYIFNRNEYYSLNSFVFYLQNEYCYGHFRFHCLPRSPNQRTTLLMWNALWTSTAYKHGFLMKQ